MSRPAAGPYPLLDAELYPDVVASGGLAPAIEELARGLGAGLGTVTPAEPQPYSAVTMAADRGAIHVFSDEGRRRFRIYLWRGEHLAAAGAAAELSEVVRVAALWRQGVLLRELADRFPFMEYTRTAQAFENGTHRETQWEQLLENPDQYRIRPLLLAARASARLVQWYPVVSHLTAARFMRKYLDKSADQVFVELRADGTYEVWTSWSGERRPAGTEREAVAVAETLMMERSRGG